MYVKLEDAEIDRLLVLALGTEQEQTKANQRLINKLSRARALSPLVGDGSIDTESKAALQLLGAPTKPAAVAMTAASTPAVSADRSHTRAELIRLRREWPTGDHRILNSPLGWLHDGEKLIPNVAEQLCLKHALLSRSDGFSFSQIASDLNGRRLRNRSGAKWTGQGVRAMIMNSALHPQNAEILAEFGGAP